MSTNTDPTTFLDDLQRDVEAVLRNCPGLTDAVVDYKDDADIEQKVARALAPIKGAATGKAGLAVIVLPPEVTDSEPNLPGPPMVVKLEVQCIEHNVINRSAAGTGIPASGAAIRVVNALHLRSLGSNRFLTASPAGPVTPNPVKAGHTSYVATLLMRAPGVTGDGRVLPVAVDLSEAPGPDIIVTGTLSPDATGTLKNAGVPPVDGAGTDAWSTDGELTAPATGRWSLLIWKPQDAIYLETYLDGVLDGWWASVDGGSGATPTIDITTAENWIAVAPATGTPAIAQTVVDSVLLACATAGAEIYYTTDGTYPAPGNTAAILYAGPITGAIVGDRYRCAAYADGLNPSDALEFTIAMPVGALGDGDLVLTDADGSFITDP